MTQEEFLKQIQELDVSFWREPKNDKNYWERQQMMLLSKRNELTLDDYLHDKWVTGGDSGGSCWNDGDRQSRPMSGEDEPEFTCLDRILEHFVPEITLLKYKKIIVLIERDSETKNEYYGNYTVYGTKKLLLRKLYEKMVELSLL